MKKSFSIVGSILLALILVILISQQLGIKKNSQKFKSHHKIIKELFSTYANDPPQLVRQLAELRNNYSDNFSNIHGLLKAYEAKDFIHVVQNTTGDIQRIKVPFFWDKEIFLDKIGIKNNDKDSVKAEKIYTFIKEYLTDGTALYRETTDALQRPYFLFNHFAHGNCGIATNMFTALAKYFGLRSKVLNLNGHVVNSTFHDGKWRVYDAQGAGIGLVKGSDGLTATHVELVNLARQNKLRAPALNKVFSKPERASFNEEIPKASFKDSLITLLPGARVAYLDDLYMITTANSNNTYNYKEGRRFYRKEFLDLYRGAMNNFIVSTPLKKEYLEEGTLVYKSDLPILGAFIQVPRSSLNQAELPVSFTSFINLTLSKAAPGEQKQVHQHVLRDGRFPRTFYPAEALDMSTSDYCYFDLTSSINNLEHIMKHRLILKNLGPYLERGPVELITVHSYATNLLEDKDIKKDLAN